MQSWVVIVWLSLWCKKVGNRPYTRKHVSLCHLNFAHINWIVISYVGVVDLISVTCLLVGRSPTFAFWRKVGYPDLYSSDTVITHVVYYHIYYQILSGRFARVEYY